MNTVRTGNRFEAHVLELLREELEAGGLALDPKCSSILPKPKYFSRDRRSDIIFDISIEVRMPGATQYSFRELGGSQPGDDQPPRLRQTCCAGRGAFSVKSAKLPHGFRPPRWFCLIFIRPRGTDGRRVAFFRKKTGLTVDWPTSSDFLGH